VFCKVPVLRPDIAESDYLGKRDHWEKGRSWERSGSRDVELEDPVKSRRIFGLVELPSGW